MIKNAKNNAVPAPKHAKGTDMEMFKSKLKSAKGPSAAIMKPLAGKALKKAKK